MPNGHTLMTTTLPTVVGAGVVSKTTETMFGRGKRKARSRKAPRAANWHTNKRVAEKDAAYFRKRGHQAKVKREYNHRLKEWGYTVHVK